MSIIVSTGSNIGNRLLNLKHAKIFLSKYFTLIKESKIYESKAVDYLNQDDFLNQILEFESPKLDPLVVLDITQSIEIKMGRHKTIPKGPRNIDIDIIFYDEITLNHPRLKIPHESWNKRSFILAPLAEIYPKKVAEVNLIKSSDFDARLY